MILRATLKTNQFVLRCNFVKKHSFSDAVENIRHPSLSRNSTTTGGASSLISDSAPPTHTHNPTPSNHPPQPTSCHQATIELIKSPTYQPSPKTPTVKHPKTPQGTSSTCLNPQNIYANVPSTPVGNFSAAGKDKYHDKDRMSCKSGASHYAKCDGAKRSEAKRTPDSSSKYERQEKVYERNSDGPKYDRTPEATSKYERQEKVYDRNPDGPKYDRALEKTYDRSLDRKTYERNPEAKQHEYIYLETNKPDVERNCPTGSEHAHHSHKKHKKVQHSSNSAQRNLTMPKTGKNSKNGVRYFFINLGSGVYSRSFAIYHEWVNGSLFPGRPGPETDT